MTRELWYRAWHDARAAARGYLAERNDPSLYAVADRMVVNGWHYEGSAYGLALIALVQRERVNQSSPRRQVYQTGPPSWPGLPPWGSRGVYFPRGCQADPGLGPMYSRR